MPPIRTTPARNQYYADVDIEEDHGFNPAWAMKPESLFPVLEPASPVRKEALPAPHVVVTQVPRNSSPSYNEDSNLDSLTWGILLPLAVVYNVVRGAGDIAGEAIRAGLRGASTVGGTVVRVGRRVFPARHNPLAGRRKRVPKTPIKDIPKDSMFVLPPHMVGATPNVVRKARGQALRGDPTYNTPTTEEARSWKLFHETPLPKKPKPPVETPLLNASNNGPDTPWKTPKFEFNTPQRKMKVGKTKEFAMNVNKGEFREWHMLLKKNGIRTTVLRRDLTENLTLPTDLILLLHDKKSNNDYRGFENLIKIFTHEGFTTHYKILVPTIKHPAPLKFREGEVKNIDLESVRQQQDGCCKFCRGFSWAGQVETREIGQNESVPCRSFHKSVLPYTVEEKGSFAQNKFEMMFQRWCRESRYDWVFEEPKLSGWEIPQDDPRLRHIAMLKQQHKFTYGAPKMYDADLMVGRNQLRDELTKQDIAAKILIDAIKKENPSLGAKYEKMNLERKRRQVKVDWLCVKQVKVIINEPVKPRIPTITGTKSRKQLKRPGEGASYQPGPEKSVKRVKFANEPAGPSFNPQKTPAKGILKVSNNSTNILKNGTPRSRKRSSIRKAKTFIGSTKSGNPQSNSFHYNSQPQPILNQPQVNSQISNLTKPNLQPSFSAPLPALAPDSNPRINFAAVPPLEPKPQEQVFFFGATSKSAGYDGQLPPSFDPAIIRKQYDTGVSSATDWWDEKKPFGWTLDPTLTKEENDAERVNFNIQKMAEYEQREKELREMELAEERARNPAPVEEHVRWRKTRKEPLMNAKTWKMVHSYRAGIRQLLNSEENGREIYGNDELQLQRLLRYLVKALTHFKDADAAWGFQ